MRTLTQETTQPQITVNASDSSDLLLQFVSKYKEYLEGNIYILQPGNNRAINAKQNIIGDREKTKELIAAAKEYGGVLSVIPSPARFLFPAANLAAQGYKFMVLHEEDIEDGGPQPRLHILDDPIRLAKVNAIADSIEIEGQREPIDVYPSPSGNGKYRVCEGRMRHTAIFKILKVQGRKGADGKVIDYILAFCKNRTELEAWEDAWILQDKESLTSYEQGAYIFGLTKKFPDVYAENRHGYNFQDTVGKRLGMSPSTVARILLAYKDVQAQLPTLDEKIANGMKNLPESIVREIRKAPPEAKPHLYEVTVEKQLQTPEVKAIIESVTENPSMTKEDIDAEAERLKQEKAAQKQKTVEEIAAERVAQINEQDDKFEKKLERNMDKIVNAASFLPEDLMTAVFGHLSLKDKNSKVTVEDAQNFALKVVAILYERASHEDIESIFAEVDANSA